MLNEKVTEKLNAQINSELSASHLYMSIAAYFASQDLTGMSRWFQAHAIEEHEHARKLFDFMEKRGARIEIGALAAPKSDFSSAADAWKTAFEHEKLVTAAIHDIFSVAAEAREYGTTAMLQWFLDEQVEEEDTFRRNYKLALAAGDDEWNLQDMDARLGERFPPSASAE